MDAIITGEGQLDYQTALGKATMGIGQAAKNKSIPTIILAGSIGEKKGKICDFGIISVFSIINKPISLKNAMKNATILLQ